MTLEEVINFLEMSHLMPLTTEERRDLDKEAVFHLMLLKVFLEEDPTPTGWISVEDGMPETEVTMAVVCRKKDGTRSWNRAWWDSSCWHGSGSFAAVTHWMPIRLPEEE